jgi:hypothetical protein
MAQHFCQKVPNDQLPQKVCPNNIQVALCFCVALKELKGKKQHKIQETHDFCTLIDAGH